MSIENYEVGKYLPVLYTIPIWDLIRTEVNPRTGKTNKVVYFPYIDKWIKPSKMIYYIMMNRMIGFTAQDYYDRWVLNITVKSDRPKCPYCGKELKFKELCSGYLRTCGSKECEHNRRSEKAINYTHSHRDVISERSKEKWKDEEYRSMMSSKLSESNNRPETKEKISKASRERWEKDYDKMVTSIRKATSDPIRNSKISNSLTEFHDNKRLEENYLAKIVAKYVPLPENPIEATKKRGRKGGPRNGILSSMYSKYESRTIYFDSDWERIFYVYNSEINSSVKSILRRDVMKIPYTYNGESHNYKPDFILIYEDGTREVIEVKPSYRMEDELVLTKLEVLRSTCESLGIKYRVVNDQEIYSMKSELYKLGIDFAEYDQSPVTNNGGSSHE